MTNKFPNGTTLIVPTTTDEANSEAMGLLTTVMLGQRDDIEIAQTITMVKYADGTYQAIAMEYNRDAEDNQLRAAIIDVTEEEFNPFKSALLDAFAMTNNPKFKDVN